MTPISNTDIKCRQCEMPLLAADLHCPFCGFRPLFGRERQLVRKAAVPVLFTIGLLGGLGVVVSLVGVVQALSGLHFGAGVFYFFFALFCAGLHGYCRVAMRQRLGRKG